MTDSPVQLIPYERQTATDAIALLEHWLERLESGEVTAIAIAGTTYNGSISTQYSKAPNQHLLHAAVAKLQHRLAAGE